MLELNDIFIDLNESQESNCKGRIYRYKESAYISARGDWCAKQSMVLMKRMSCSGCEDCGGLIELLEQICYPEEIIFPNKLKTDGLYILGVECEESGTYEYPEQTCYPKFIEYREYDIKILAPIKDINMDFKVKFQK